MGNTGPFRLHSKLPTKNYCLALSRKLNPKNKYLLKCKNLVFLSSSSSLACCYAGMATTRSRARDLESLSMSLILESKQVIKNLGMATARDHERPLVRNSPRFFFDVSFVSVSCMSSLLLIG